MPAPIPFSSRVAFPSSVALWRLALGLVASCLAVSCAAPQRVFDPGRPTVDEVLESGARILWVGAHPDDETMAGPVLAKGCYALGNPCVFVVMNKGAGGECLLPEGCNPDLPTVRSKEVQEVARLYKAKLVQYDYFNASLPVTSFPDRDEIARRWIAAGDPTARLTALIRDYQPDVVFTFDPDHGFTCHPEHQLAARFAMQAVRQAADPSVRVHTGRAPHRVAHVYSVLNHHWLTRFAMGGDPGPHTDVFDPDQSCGGEETCMDVTNRISESHRTQAGDMGRARFASKFIGEMYLRRVEPWSAAPSPLAPAPGWCE